MKISARVAAAVLLLSAASAHAGTAIVDVTGIVSMDGLDDPDNVIMTVDFGAPATVTGIGWDVTITPVDASWYSEATVAIENTAGEGIFLSPAGPDAEPGFGVPRSYSSGGILPLAGEGLPNISLPDGILVLTFLDAFDDYPDAPDATWGGTLEFAVVPVPAAAWLFLSGIVGLLGLGRRR